MLLARALSRDPRALVAAQPTRGLDVGAYAYVHEQLRRVRDAGGGVLLISEDLDELLALADRVVVLFAGRIVGELPREDATPRALGLLMTGHEVAVVNLVLRAGSSRWRAPIAVALAVVATFLITAIPIRAGGANPAAAYWRYLVTPLTSWNGVQEVLLAASPLLLTGLAVAIAFRAGYYNIGAEGQFLAGAIGATVPGPVRVRPRCLAGASARPLGRRRRRDCCGRCCRPGSSASPASTKW